MTLSNSRLSYRDEYTLMQQAIDLPNGARAFIGTHGDAINYRLRLNKARQLDRNLNAQAYEPGHLLYGGSVFDELIITLREDTEGNWWVYLEKSKQPYSEPIEAAE